MLQDLRHLIILDFRSAEDYKENHIRKSVHVSNDDYMQRLTEIVLKSKLDKIHPFRSHFEGDNMKRLLCVFPSTGGKALETQLNKDLPPLNE